MSGRILTISLRIVCVCLLTASVCVLLFSFDNKYTAPTPRGAEGMTLLGEADAERVNFLISGWAVHGGVLLGPDDFITDPPQPDRYIFIGQYGGFENFAGSPHGSVTYRMTVGIPEQQRAWLLALPEIYSSYRVYINGTERFSLGQPDPTAFRFETGNAVIPFEAAGEIELIVAVSDFAYIYSGMVYPPVLGAPEAVLRMLNTRFALRMAAVAAAFVIGLASLIIGLMSKRKGMAVLYGLLCLFFVGHTWYPVAMTLMRGNLLFYTVENVSFNAMLLVIILIQGRIAREKSRTVTRLRHFMLGFGGLTCVAAAAITFAAPHASISILMAYSHMIELYKWAVAAYVIVCAGLMVWKRTVDAAFLFYGMLAFACTLVMDRALPVHEPILSGWFPELGGFVLILSVGLMTVREVIRQYRESAVADERIKIIISSGRQHYQEMNEMYDTLHVLRHDYKYHINTIGKLAAAGNMDEIKKYVAGAGAWLPKDDLKVYCDNSAINALLGSYEERCAKEGIEYTVNIALPKNKTIEDWELCILLGNLLENAFAACIELERGRYIKLSAKTQGNTFGIVVKNSFNGDVTVESGEFVSKKANGGNGVKSIESIANRHGGDFIPQWDEGSFQAYVVMDVT